MEGKTKQTEEQQHYSSVIIDNSSRSFLFLPCYKNISETEQISSVSEIKLVPLWDAFSWSPLPLHEKVETAHLWKSYGSRVL